MERQGSKILLWPIEGDGEVIEVNILGDKGILYTVLVLSMDTSPTAQSMNPAFSNCYNWPFRAAKSNGWACMEPIASL
jgi:hypothetical protein